MEMKKFTLYPETIMKHFKRPKNMGKMRNPSGVGKVGNLLCGDVLWLYIKVKKGKDGKERIVDVKFECFGCVVAIGISSVLTTLVKGKTLEEALKIKKDDLLKATGPLPPIKVHCSVLAADALKEAIYDYYARNKLPIPEHLKKEHERIKKTLEKVEERFRKYVELQKEISKRV